MIATITMNGVSRYGNENILIIGVFDSETFRERIIGRSITIQPTRDYQVKGSWINAALNFQFLNNLNEMNDAT